MSESASETAPYMNSRIAGMRSFLLPKDEYERLLDLGDVTRMTDAMLASTYQQDMAEALTRFHGADAVEEAVTRSLVRTFHTLYGLTQGNLRELTQVFMTRWDLIAVKSLLRARHLGLDADLATEGLIPGPSLTVPLLRAFAEKDSMESLIAALTSWNSDICGALGKNFAEYQRTHNVAVLEEALDRAYFVNSVRALASADDEDSKILRTVLQMEIDRINIRTVLQLREPGLSADALTARLIPKGTLREDTLREMATANSTATAIEYLAKTRYASLADKLQIFVQSGRFSPIERVFDLMVIQHLKREVLSHVMSIAVLMHYTWVKYNEVVNLRIIARGEASRLPRGRIREEVMYA